MSSSPQAGNLQPSTRPGFAPHPPGAQPLAERTENHPQEDDTSVTAFRYPEVAPGLGASWGGGEPDLGGNLAGPEERLRAAAVQAGEERARAWYAGEIEREREMLWRALEAFARQREIYFLNIERETVQLTLGIARKVLEREARVDPLAVAAMLHVALAPLQTGTAVTLRVHPAAAQDWRVYFAAREGTAPGSGVSPVIVEDASLAQGDCVVATAMGTAEVSLGQKLQEIEASFLELLAQRPGVSA